MFRKNAFSTILAIGALLAITLGLLIIAKPAHAGPSKVEVCHVPPDDPDNFHTITVSESALSAHIAHFDLGGACDSNCADLCDDGDLCTTEDYAGCDDGCPVPVPVNCGEGQTCDSVRGCIPVVDSSCPCFSADDLAGADFCGEIDPNAPDVAGCFIGSIIACVGDDCDESIDGASCAYSNELPLVGQAVTEAQELDCRGLIAAEAN